MKPKDKTMPVATVSKASAQPEIKKRTIDEELLPPKLTGVEGNDDVMNINGKERDKLFKTIGTRDLELAAHFFRQLDNVSVFHDQKRLNHVNTALAIMHDIKPRDQLEAMLVMQMIGAHNIAMSFMGRAVREDQSFFGAEACINWSTKFLRTFTAQFEALTRYRGGGQQKVTVEHVHVNEGGQAIVGMGGGGKL